MKTFGYNLAKNFTRADGMRHIIKVCSFFVLFKGLTCTCHTDSVGNYNKQSMDEVEVKNY